MEHLLEILGEFGGGRGEPDDIVVRFLLPMVFWVALWVIATQRWHEHRERRDLVIAAAAALGFSRELLMFVSQWGAWQGYLSFHYVHHLYPPIEHAANLGAGVLLGYAHLSYGGTPQRRAPAYLLAGTLTVTVLYALVAQHWPIYLDAHPEVTFGSFWGDMVFRIAGSVLLGWVLGVLVFARVYGEQVPPTLLVAFAFLFLDEFLMVFNLASGEAHKAIYTPIRHNLHIWAVLLFVLAYGARQRIEIRRSERELRRAQEVARLGSWTLYPGGSELACSRELLRIFGLVADNDWNRVPLTRFVPRILAADRERLTEAAGGALAHPGESIEIEFSVGDGERFARTVLARGVAPLNRHGRVRRLIGTLQDVTEQRRAEATLWRTRLAIIERLALAAEYRSAETGRHLVRMSYYAELIARAADLDAEHSELIRQAAPMHDIGKIGIPDRILFKAGRLTAEEMAVVRRHPEIGAALLAGDESEPIRTARLIALTHHERWDGGGYPAGIAGVEIPVEGRICAIADVFDALTTERTYKKAWDQERTVDFIRTRGGTHFDPDIVTAFLTALPEIERFRTTNPEPVSASGRVGLAVVQGAAA